MIAGLFGSVPLAAAALAALFLDLSLWPWLGIGAAVAMTFLVTRNSASRIAVDPEDGGTPLAILVIQGVRLWNPDTFSGAYLDYVPHRFIATLCTTW